MLERLEKQVAILKKKLERCDLCPRQCKVNRYLKRKGFCGLGADIKMERALAHFGEEPPISGKNGAGTIFFTSCNLKCLYCQNYQLSHEGLGRTIEVSSLVSVMISLQEKGCHNIELVTPTPQVGRIMEALLKARRLGLKIPLVYNTGGYERVETLKLLDGLVDIYLPDFKYGLPQDSLLLSGVHDYPYRTIFALKEMVRQQGEELLEEGGIAIKGVLIRHLVLPGKTENSRQVLKLIKRYISTRIPISIMAQYTPLNNLTLPQELHRRLTRKEYEAVVDFAFSLGFRNLFLQEVSDEHLVPDFRLDLPFPWKDYS